MTSNRALDYLAKVLLIKAVGFIPSWHRMVRPACVCLILGIPPTNAQDSKVSQPLTSIRTTYGSEVYSSEVDAALQSGELERAAKSLREWRHTDGFTPEVCKAQYKFFTTFKRYKESDLDIEDEAHRFLADLHHAIQAKRSPVNTLTMAMPFAMAAITSKHGPTGAEPFLTNSIHFLSDLLDAGHFDDEDSSCSACSVLVSLHRNRFPAKCLQGERQGATEDLLKLFRSWASESEPLKKGDKVQRYQFRSHLIPLAEMLLEGGTPALTVDFPNQLRALAERWEQQTIERDEEFLQIVQLRLMISKAMIASNVSIALKDFNEAIRCIDSFSKTPESQSSAAIEQAKDMAASIRKKVIHAKQIQDMMGSKAIEISSVAKIGSGPGSLSECNGKVVLLDFWAVWCGPCQQMLPVLNRFAEQYKADGLEVIGVTRPYNMTWDAETQTPQKMPPERVVSLEEEVEMLNRFHKKQNLTYPTLLTGKDKAPQTAYHVEGLPHLVLIGRDGTIRKVWMGNGVEASDLEKALQLALE